MRELCRFSFGLLWLVVALLLVGCGPPSLPTSPADASPAAATVVTVTSPVESKTAPDIIAPTVGPQNALSDATPGLLAGAITGVDPGDSISLRLEFLEPTSLRPELSEPLPRRTLEPGEVVERFPVVNGPWQAAALVLEPGRYRLIPEVEEYVSIPGVITFQVPGAFVAWRYLRMDFEFLHPADAPARVGVPLCPELPSPGGTYVLPEGAPTPTPSSPPTGTSPPPPSDLDTWPAGTCYAGHLADAWEMPAGLQGQISGLSPGQVATITVYTLPPDPGENYAIGEAPPADASWIYPPEVTPLAEPPVVAPNWPLTATLTVRNGPWGLVDPSLAGSKYLVIARSPGQVVEPPAYEVVIFAGKAPGLPGGVDFVFEAAHSTASLATPLRTPAADLTLAGPG